MYKRKSLGASVIKFFLGHSWGLLEACQEDQKRSQERTCFTDALCAHACSSLDSCIHKLPLVDVTHQCCTLVSSGACWQNICVTAQQWQGHQPNSHRPTQASQYTSSQVVSDSNNHHHTIRPLNSFATGVNIASTLIFAKSVPRTAVLWLSELIDAVSGSTSGRGMVKLRPGSNGGLHLQYSQQCFVRRGLIVLLFYSTERFSLLRRSSLFLPL